MFQKSCAYQNLNNWLLLAENKEMFLHHIRSYLIVSKQVLLTLLVWPLKLGLH